MAPPGDTTRDRRRAGMERLAGLLAELRGFPELREVRTGVFQIGSKPFLHFHFPASGRLIADVRLSKRGFTPFDVSDEAGRHELVAAIEGHLESSAREGLGARR